MRADQTSTMIAFLLGGLLAGTAAPASAAAPLTSAKVTETKNVVVYKPEAGAERPAQVADVIEGAAVLRTGKRSLAEIEFGDKTITRLGSKSVFTFNAATREFHPGKGTTLIYVPKGMGGGRIVTPAVTAAIEGTTVIVQEIDLPPAPGQAAPRLLSKVIFLEGTGNVTLTHQRAVCPVNNRKIGPGQMIAQFADDPCLAEVQTINLDVLVKRSAILTAFTSPLASMPLITAVIGQQQTDLGNGTLKEPSSTAGIYSPNPLTGGQGIENPWITQPSAVQGTVVYVGDGFYLTSRPIGDSSEPIQNGGGYFSHR